MELTAYNTFICEVILLCKLMFLNIKIGNFLPEPLFFIQLFANFFSNIWNQHSDNDVKPATTQPATDTTQCSIPIRNCGNHIDRRTDRLGIGEIKMVMGKLGLEYSEAMGNIAGTEVPSIFDQEEPSLDEIKDAFDVFDVNRDGFIDAVELQGVLCNLGQSVGLEECKKMIQGFDQNGDGLIDFREFVRLMEKSFC